MTAQHSVARDMLESMYSVLRDRFHDEQIAWDRMIDFLAFDLNGWLLPEFDHKFEWMFEDKHLCSKLRKHYLVTHLSNDKTDPVGQMYLEQILGRDNQHRYQTVLPMNLAKNAAESIVPVTSSQIMAVCSGVGTGRILIEAAKRAPNAVYFGAERDIRALRIAYLNVNYHRVHAFLLHANPEVHEIDPFSTIGLQNWQYSNCWNSHMDELKPRTNKLLPEEL